ncbi:ABC transporter ATP-binding protein [Proteinivorax hydrogeniformans]|uniref:ABC transporter ATP-binding protein n=2 Tax=Proteinivorax hydrogeniformans TaxID=1826727 RepID=A0AAU8HX51_9FIRM
MMNNNEPVIKIRGLSKTFGLKTVLKGIDLDVYAGQIIGYIGPNGAGKSTTVKILLGVIDQYHGSIEVLGENIATNNGSYKYKVGYVPESGEIYDSLTAEEYLAFIGELYGMDTQHVEEKVLALMSIFGIEGSYHARISSFSKGMRQKLLIIASLMHNPDIIFFDEPLNGLDANSVIVFKEIMLSLAKEGKTIFYSSHIMEVVEKISNRIVLINNGEIIADGTFDQLKELSKKGSLEGVFNQLTGFDKHNEVAEQFVSVIKEV